MPGVFVMAVAIAVAGPFVIAGLSRCSGMLVVFVTVAVARLCGRSFYHRRRIVCHRRLFYRWRIVHDRRSIHHWRAIHNRWSIHPRRALPRPPGGFGPRGGPTLGGGPGTGGGPPPGAGA